MKGTTTLILSGPIVATGGLLPCDDGDFRTVTLASTGGDCQVVLAGSRHDLLQVVRAATAALLDETAP